MRNILEKIIGDFEEKKVWKEMKTRVKALPEDYRTTYEEIQKYLWMTSGIGSIDPFKNLIDLFEEGSANGRSVLEITGSDVAAFADELVRGEQTYFDKYRRNLNNNIMKKLGNSNIKNAYQGNN